MTIRADLITETYRWLRTRPQILALLVVAAIGIYLISGGNLDRVADAVDEVETVEPAVPAPMPDSLTEPADEGTGETAE